MLRGIVLILCVFALLIASVRGSPLNGGRSTFVEIASHIPHEETVRFRGGERACVIAKWHPTKKGDSRPDEALIEIEIFDVEDRPIAAARDSSGYAVVFWYPPRESTYRIRIRNASQDKYHFYLTVK